MSGHFTVNGGERRTIRGDHHTIGNVTNSRRVDVREGKTAIKKVADGGSAVLRGGDSTIREVGDGGRVEVFSGYHDVGHPTEVIRLSPRTTRPAHRTR
ncbi:hypothetical protein GCM10023195_32010 [Actinoallomurus liliacearum]|uniref:Uncharacterized protein n=1 Tax=Actinoallomurus liliacearum TaxID=1080073 RepID=A0ABP8TJR4_9ACTN